MGEQSQEQSEGEGYGHFIHPCNVFATPPLLVRPWLATFPVPINTVINILVR